MTPHDSLSASAPGRPTRTWALWHPLCRRVGQDVVAVKCDVGACFRDKYSLPAADHVSSLATQSAKTLTYIALYRPIQVFSNWSNLRHNSGL